MAARGMSESIVIRPMQPGDYARCVELYARAFLTRNAMTVNLGIAPSAFRACIEHETAKCCYSGAGVWRTPALSLVAVGAGGSIAGFLFVERFSLFTQPAPEANLDPGLRTMSDNFFRLYHRAFRRARLPLRHALRGRCARVVAGGTARAHEGRGVATALRAACVASCAARGFARVLAECAHPATRRIWVDKLGARVLATLPYAEFSDRHAGGWCDWFRCRCCRARPRRFPLARQRGALALAMVAVRRAPSACGRDGPREVVVKLKDALEEEGAMATV